MDTASGGPKATVPCGSCGRLNRLDLDRARGGAKCGSCGRGIALDRPVVATDANFERMLGGAEVPLLVDFYADWCGPCKIMAPLLDQLARDHAGEIVVSKLDTDRNAGTAGRFAIRGIPTLIVFVGGREVGREVGAVPKPRLEALVASARRAG